MHSNWRLAEDTVAVILPILTQSFFYSAAAERALKSMIADLLLVFSFFGQLAWGHNPEWGAVFGQPHFQRIVAFCNF